MRIPWIAQITVFCFVGTLMASIAVAQQPESVKLLYQGEAKRGVEVLSSELAKEPSDQLRMELGTLQFFAAFEYLGQKFQKHGKLNDMFGMLPLLRLETGSTVKPSPISYEEFRLMIEEFQKQIDASYETLSLLDPSDVQLSLNLARVHLDLNADGVPSEEEELVTIARRVLSDLQQQEDLIVDFDYADAIWLQGYCSLVSAMCDVTLAVNFEESWDIGARTVFSEAESSYPFLMEQDANPRMPYFFVDVIAMIHKSSFPVEDRNRMISAHEKLLRMVQLSRDNWSAIHAETDQSREWLPSPTQHGFQPRIRVQQEMVETWGKVLDEWEALLQGDKLVPFWRGNNEALGVNLKRAFYELETIDPIMLIQGADLIDFLEEGEQTSTQQWESFARVFQGNFLGFAIWAN